MTPIKPEAAIALLREAIDKVIRAANATYGVNHKGVAVTLLQGALDATDSIEAATSEPVDELDAVMADANLSHIACMMSNMMYNLSQNPGRQLTADDCEKFDNIRKQWDAARRAAPVSQEAPAVTQLAELLKMSKSLSVTTLRKGLRMAIAALCDIASAEPAPTSEPVAGACPRDCCGQCPQCRDWFNAARIAPPASQEAPAGREGWQWVPKTPTQEMCRAGDEAAGDSDSSPAADGYRAMLSAAPQPPASTEPAPLQFCHDGGPRIEFVPLKLEHDWDEPAPSESIAGELYRCVIEHCVTGEKRECTLLRVAEDDCDWRTADDHSELSNSWSVVEWAKEDCPDLVAPTSAEGGDAARYRHIRDTRNNGYHLEGVTGIGKWHIIRKREEGMAEFFFGERLDDKIDSDILAADRASTTDKGDGL